jgi:hypothetical protein
MQRRTLSLKPRVDPATKPKVDPAKVEASELLGLRFVDKGGRYLMQKLVVAYLNPDNSLIQNRELSRTWIDVPLVPEAYYP